MKMKVVSPFFGKRNLQSGLTKDYSPFERAATWDFMLVYGPRFGR